MSLELGREGTIKDDARMCEILSGQYDVVPVFGSFRDDTLLDTWAL